MADNVARPARSARRRRPIDFSGAMRAMSQNIARYPQMDMIEAMGGVQRLGPDQAREAGAPALERALALEEIPDIPRLDVADPQGRRDAAVRYAAEHPISVESGGWGEAAAEALTQILGGRVAAREFDRDKEERDEERFQARGARNALKMAAQAPNASPAMLSAMLSEYSPEAAMNINLGQQERAQDREDKIWALDEELNPDRAGRRREIAVADETALLTAREPFQIRSDARQRAARQSGRRELSPREEKRIEEASDAATASRRMRDSLAEFQGLNRVVRTGPGSGALGIGQLFNRDRQRMNQITDGLLQYVRQAGTGTMTDADKIWIRNSIPNVDQDGRVNDAAIAALSQAAQNDDDRAVFMDAYSQQYGTLRGSEQQWSQYLRANPIFDRNGQLRSDRPTFEEWIAAPRDMSGARAPGNRSAPSDDLVEPAAVPAGSRRRRPASVPRGGGLGGY